MRTELTEDKNGERKQSRVKRWVAVSSFGLLGVALFMFGVAVGNGRIGGMWWQGDGQTGLPSTLDFSRVEELYDVLRRNYDGELAANDLLDGMMHGLASATGDPYTAFLNAEEAEEFNQQLSGTFSGIGAELGVDEEDNIIIVSPIDGFPAQKAGLRPQDRIVGIDGESIAGLTIFEAVNKIRGPKGSEVTLQILRGDEEMDITITREDITIPSVEYEIIDNVGYVQINQFGEDTSKLTQEAAEHFKKENVKGVVLDLRGNPGGLLNVAVDVASLWLPKGTTVLQQKTGDTVISTETALGGDVLNGMPTAVLINEGSASASEIVAGALKDNNVATLIGAKSYGKGSVQEIHPLSDGSEVKVTVARWFRPNGENIDKQGVEPDKKVKMTEEDYDKGRDPQKQAALEFIQNDN